MSWKKAVFVLVVFFSMSAFAAVPEYIVRRTTGKIILDGILDEKDWALAEPVREFAFPWWTSGEKEQTEVKMLWNDDFLYVAFACRDKHIWADHYDTNSATCEDDCVEIFWNPNPDAGDMYYMFEMNCIGNLLSVYNNFVRSINERESRVMVPRIGQILQGSVNNDSDTDTGWVLEVAVRFSDYPELSGPMAPAAGDMWRVGLNRCGGKTNAQYSQWSPSRTDTPNFHKTDDFGRIVFSDLPAGSGIGVDDETGSSFPEAVMLLGNFPNPFNAFTTLQFSLPSDGLVMLEIYSIVDQKVRELVSETLPAGVHSVVWDGMNDEGLPVSSGVYLSRLRMGKHVASGRMMLVK